MDKRLKYLNALRCFESAARHQSYSKAAEEQFVSQAAVSQQMRQLEEVVGTKLFVRKGRQMQLTQSGSKLYQTTHKAFNALLQTLNEIQCEDVAGNLTVTSTQSFSSLWLMPRLYKFSIKHPDIRISVVGSNHVEDLQQGHIDLAIRFGNGGQRPTEDELHYESFGEDQVYPVCSPQLMQQMAIKAPQDVLKCWLVTLANQGGITWQSWFEAAGVVNVDKHSLWTEVTSGDMALSAVLSGHGFTLAATALFSQYVDVGRLVRPFDIEHPVSFKRYLVYRPNSAKQARLKLFIDWLKEEMALS